MQGKLRARIAGGQWTGSGQRDRLLDGADRIDAQRDELKIAIGKEGHATRGSFSEQRSVEQTIGSLEDQLFFEANRGDRKTCGSEACAGKSEQADFVFFADAGGSGEDQFGGSFGDTNAEESSIGTVTQREAMALELLTKEVFPVFTGFGGERGILKKFELEGAVEVRHGDETVDELAKSGFEGDGVLRLYVLRV